MTDTPNATTEQLVEALRTAFPEPPPAPFGAIARIEGVESDSRLQADDMLTFANQLLKDGVDRDQIVVALKENGYALAGADTRSAEVQEFEQVFPPAKSAEDFKGINYRDRMTFASTEQMIGFDTKAREWLFAIGVPGLLPVRLTPA